MGTATIDKDTVEKLPEPKAPQLYYAKRYDVFGEHTVQVVANKMEDIGDGDDIEAPTDEKNHKALAMMWLVSKDLKNRKRQVPLTMAEAENFVKPKQLRKLEEAGYMVKRLLTIHSKASGNKNTGSRACICFTDKGRRYAKGNIDEKNTSELPGAGSSSVGDLGRQDSGPVGDSV